jgi:guanylate kinase
LLFIVSSPSGGGKTTLIREAIVKLAELGFSSHFSISHTTRTPRPAEKDGLDYHFVDRPSFETMAQHGEFLEWAEYADNLYGTAHAEVERHLEAGENVFLDIEVQGANQVRTLMPEVIKIFVYPPSYEVLKERLTQRRQDPPEVIQKRLAWAMGEFRVAGEFDYAIINDRLEQAVSAVVGICLAERYRYERVKDSLSTFRQAFKTALEKDRTS